MKILCRLTVEYYADTKKNELGLHILVWTALILFFFQQMFVDFKYVDYARQLPTSRTLRNKTKFLGW
jgi:hypothetical protein